MKAHMVISGSVVRIYATILGFVIVFRTNMAFNRYFDGVLHVKAMLSKWRDAFVSLCCFIEASSLNFQAKGNVEAVSDLADSKAKLTHWFTLITALVVQKLASGGEIGPLFDHMSTVNEPTNRMNHCSTEASVR